MIFRFKTTLALAAWAMACSPSMAAIEMDGVALDDSAVVAGKNLKLNGAGISFRLIFKVYAMGLYLLDRKVSLQDVLATDGPRRMVIAMLRDVSSEEFDDAVISALPTDGEDTSPRITSHMQQLGKAIARQPKGLRKGDTLTLDWVPGTGTVIELNKKPLMEPLHDIAFYNALLNIWLGDKPADPSLKTKLLGRSSQLRASTN